MIKILDVEFAKKVRKNLKGDGVRSIRVQYDFNEEKSGRLEICIFYDNGGEYTISTELFQEYVSAKKILFLLNYPDDAVLDFILANEYYFELYSHNYKDISINDSDKIYFMDTIFFRTRKKRIRLDNICSEYTKVIFN